MCQGVSANTQHQAGKAPPLPNSRLGPAGAPGLPALGQSCRGLSRNAVCVVAGSTQSPRPRLHPRGPPRPPGGGAGLEGTPGLASAALAPRPATAHLFNTLRILWRTPAREEADRLPPPPPPSAGRFSIVVTTWFGGAGGDGCSCCCGGSGGIIAAKAAARRRSEHSPAHRAPAPGPGTRRGPGGRPRPGGSVLPAKLRGGEAPAATLPPPPSPPLSPLQSQGAHPRLAAASRPSSSREASPSPGTPREVAVKGVARDRRAAGCLRRPPRREGMGLPASPSLPSRRSSPGERRLSLSPTRSESCRLCLTE